MKYLMSGNEISGRLKHDSFFVKSITVFNLIKPINRQLRIGTRIDNNLDRLL